MNKKTAINILTTVIIIAVLIVVYIIFFVNNDKKESTNNNLLDQPTPISNFFPESEYQNPNETSEQPQINTKEIPKLRQISKNPVAGFTVFDQKIASTSEYFINNETEGSTTTKEQKETVYRFVNKSNGNIFETTSKTTETSRLTNATIPQIQKALFLNNSDFVVFEYLNDMNLSEISLVEIIRPKNTRNDKNSTSTPEIKNDEVEFYPIEKTVLGQQIMNVLTSNGLIFYSKEAANRKLEGFVVDPKTPKNAKSIFSLNFKYLNIFWKDKNNLLLGTKPSEAGDNYLFNYNVDTKNKTKIDEFGKFFTFKPNGAGDLILYSEVSGDNIGVFAQNLITKDYYNLDLSSTAGDKCVWSNVETGVVYCAIPKEPIKSKNLLAWYKGEVSFVDDLYRVDIFGGTSNKIALDGNFDVTEPMLSETGEFFVFINKKDLSLWSLDILD